MKNLQRGMLASPVRERSPWFVWGFHGIRLDFQVLMGHFPTKWTPTLREGALETILQPNGFRFVRPLAQMQTVKKNDWVRKSYMFLRHSITPPLSFYVNALQFIYRLYKLIYHLFFPIILPRMHFCNSSLRASLRATA